MFADENSREIVDASAVEAKMTPIELMFWRAAKEHSGDEVHLVPSPDLPFELWKSGPVDIPTGDIVIAFQVHAISHVVDFAVSRRLSSHGTVLVECDGHEWHERTKEQALRDRSRDRYMQRLGRIHRYTGSELYHDALECWKETLRALNSEHLRENHLRASAKTALLTGALATTAPDGGPAFSIGLRALIEIQDVDVAMFTADELAAFGVTPETFSSVRETLRPYLDMRFTTSGHYALRLAEPWIMGFRP